MAAAKAWALRCRLELQLHDSAVFTTLTYSDEKLPPTLRKVDLQLFLKRLRRRLGSTRPVRFFASGEYGERTARPHYHAILYGLDKDRDADLIEATWGNGHTHTDSVSPASIAYVAGYTAKKIGWRREEAQERVDPETGEVYQWQPPFVQMSRRPGIGGHARQWPSSWRLYAVDDGYKMPVPRFLHDSWKAQASKEEIEELLDIKSRLPRKDTSETALRSRELSAISKHSLQSLNRKL